MAERGAGLQGGGTKAERLRGWRSWVRRAVLAVVLLAQEGEGAFGGHCRGGLVWT